MPEGDTIHKIAAFMAPLLKEKTVRRMKMSDAAGASQCAGRRVRRVRAQGKHLFIELDNDTALRTHLGMYGSWHRYSENETWRKPAYQASLELATDSDVFVCFNAREVELLRSPGVRRRVIDTRLGPDLSRHGADVARAVNRARQFLDGDSLICDVLLDQRAACGIGNVYKSEVLFINRRLPDTPLSKVTDQELTLHYSTAAELLLKNLGGGKRVTRFEGDRAGRLWVYGRRGMPCLRCDGVIVSARMGKHHRGTHWCAGCQT